MNQFFAQLTLLGESREGHERRGAFPAPITRTSASGRISRQTYENQGTSLLLRNRSVSEEDVTSVPR